MTGPAYPASRKVAALVKDYFARHIATEHQLSPHGLALQPDNLAIEEIIDAAFWASLRREEGYFPKISLAYLPQEEASQPLIFERLLPFTPASLSRLAPAVERPGIHLGVWRYKNSLALWGTTRSIPRLCMVLEVVEPGLLVIKYRRGHDPSKYVNVVVLKGDEIKIVDEGGASIPDCPDLLKRLLGFSTFSDSVNLLVELAVSIREHGRGGTLLVVPKGRDRWRESILQPVSYSITPSYNELAELMRLDAKEQNSRSWQEALQRAVDAVAGLTAVDGATLINDQYEVLAFGAKIGRREGGLQVEQVVMTEPVVGNAAAVINPVQLGGTRHLSAAQFVQDQRDSVAFVASQDGGFTIFSWSPCENIVHAHRVETLLL